MMESGTRVRAATGVCFALAFTFVIALLLSVQFDFYYDLNDDTMIKDILSGAYTGSPDGHCIQMLYPLGWCLALFYRAFPNIAWFGLFLCLCQFGVFFFIALRLLLITKSIWTGIMALAVELLLMSGLFLRELVIVQYSVTAGICMAGAAFLFVTAPRDCKPSTFFSRNMLSLFLVLLAFMIRTEICMMLMPFLVIAGLSMWFSEKRIFTAANFKKYFVLGITLALCVTALYSLDMLAYKDSEWVSFRRFFDARTKLYDFYGLPQYDEHREFYESIGLSGESYALLENYNFALDNSIDAWRLEAIVEYQERLASYPNGTALNNTYGFISKNSIKEAMWLYKNQIFSCFGKNINMMSVPLIAVAAAYLAYIFNCILLARGRRRLVSILTAAAILAVRSGLWLYLYMVDRVLPRVTTPLFAAELSVVIGFAICGASLNDKSFPKTSRYAATVAFAVLIMMSFINFHSVQQEYDMRAAADERWNALMDYCRRNGNNYYIVDVYSATSYGGAPYSEKMFLNANFEADNSYKNFDACGGWSLKSPFTRQKLEKRRLNDIQGALIGARGGDGVKTYFVADVDKELEWLVKYYKMRGFSVELECVGTMRTSSGEAAFNIYGLKRG